MKTYQYKKARCPWCGLLVTGCTNVFTDEKPIPNSSCSMCIFCGGISMISDDEGTLRKPTLNESMWIDRDPRVAKLLEAWTNRPWVSRPKVS